MNQLNVKRDNLKKENTKKENTKKENQKVIDEYDYLSNAASMQDCTGLIPAKPESAEELEAYEELYHFLPPGGRASSL